MKHLLKTIGQQWMSGILLIALLGSCNVMQYVPEDEKLYTGAQVTINSNASSQEQSELKSAVSKALSPDPNSSILGLRVGLWAHYKVANDEAGFYARFVNDRFGEEPVYLSDVKTGEMEKIIRNRSINNGFFYPRIRSDIEEKEKTASASYTIRVGEAYHMASYEYIRDSLQIDTLIRQSMTESLIDSGSRFDLSLFKDERSRIDAYLKDRGYYQFTGDYLIFTSDTNQYDTELYDLFLDMKEKVKLESQLPYLVNKVSVYPDYSIDDYEGDAEDTTIVDSISFLQDEVYFKPHLLREYIIVEPGHRYSKRLSDITTRRLSGLGIYRFATIRYDVQDSMLTDSLGYLNASILLTPGPKYSLRAGMNAVTKSSGFAGPGFNATFQNRNLFHGGEILEISGNIGYEVQIARGNSKNLNNLQFSLENSLNIPRLLAPFIKVDPRKVYSIPNTKFQLNYTLQQRALYYTINSFLLGYNYNWNSSRFIYQQFTPLSITYSLVSNETEEFQQILDQNQFLRRSFADQFIPAIEYVFQYSELGKVQAPHSFYFNATAGEAGGITGLYRNKTKDLLGQPFAQYIKGDIDFRHYWQWADEKKWVSRLFLGAGYPYGNSSSLPFIKQYFSGGPSSIRAFQVRSVGPGTYNPSDTGAFSFFDQSGDIRLELNTEYRFPLVNILKGAVFFDAGNIWLMNENPDLPGGAIDANWSQELALGTGVGFRLDIDVLVIRLDLGYPLRYPYEVNGSHWVQSASFGDIVWNFAIGYPF